MTVVSSSEERAAFEKWAAEQGWEIGIRYPDEHPTYGRYEEGAIQYMWAAWRTRAGRDAPTARIEALLRIEAKVRDIEIICDEFDMDPAQWLIGGSDE
jgi:hypothetical protein